MRYVEPFSFLLAGIFAAGLLMAHGTTDVVVPAGAEPPASSLTIASGTATVDAWPYIPGKAGPRLEKRSCARCAIEGYRRCTEGACTKCKDCVEGEKDCCCLHEGHECNCVDDDPTQ